MHKLKPRTMIPTAEEDTVITAAAIDDPDSRPFTDEEWADVKPVRGRGRPVQPITKTPISIRLDVRVLNAFKATGEGWQTRINDALTEWADQHGMLEHSQN
jgi:uncharacterized protein (DUF4415 family)